MEIVAQLELPAMEAYTRLRAAEALAAGGDPTEALGILTPALDFFRSVSATRWLEQAEALLAHSA
jgi:hypothetical protein